MIIIGYKCICFVGFKSNLFEIVIESHGIQDFEHKQVQNQLSMIYQDLEAIPSESSTHFIVKKKCIKLI